MIRRQRFPKLPTQANFYPLAAAGYIEDKRVRLTVVSGQPLGASSMASGQFEVNKKIKCLFYLIILTYCIMLNKFFQIMQDRRLMQDDGRGLEQGVTDNLLTNHVFMLVLEKRKPSCTGSIIPNHPAGMLSIVGHLTSEELLHPFVALHPHSTSAIDFNGHFSPLRFDLPIDLAIVNLRVFPVPEGAGKGVGMTLHRQALDICWGDNTVFERFNISKTGEINLNKFLTFMEDWTISEAPLTFTSVGPSFKSSTIHLCPHQLSSILFHKTQS